MISTLRGKLFRIPRERKLANVNVNGTLVSHWENACSCCENRALHTSLMMYPRQRRHTECQVHPSSTAWCLLSCLLIMQIPRECRQCRIVRLRNPRRPSTFPKRIENSPPRLVGLRFLYNCSNNSNNYNNIILKIRKILSKFYCF